MNRDLNKTHKNRESILLVFNYGASIKNVLLNETLWNYFTNNYEVDILSDTDIENCCDIGIRKLTLFRSKLGWFSRILKKIDNFMISRISSMHSGSVYLDTGFAFIYGGIYRNWYITDKRKSSSLFWSAFRRSYCYKKVESILNWFPLFTSWWFQDLKTAKYKFIFISNFIAPESFPIGRYANLKKIPVFASIMGIDNVLTGGAFMAVPDILFLWGQEQKNEFEQIQKSYNSSLRSSRIDICGNLIFDTYLRTSVSIDCRKHLLKKYSIPLDHELILFPAHVMRICPNQIALCKRIIRFVQQNKLKITLLVRVRPGIDEEAWRGFEQESQGKIKLQIPHGSSYDKSLNRNCFLTETEEEEIKDFVATFKSTALLVSPSFSSTVIDAGLFSVPSFIAAYGRGDYSIDEERLRINILHQFHKHRGGYNVFFCEDELLNSIYKFFIENKRNGFVSKELFETIAFSDDGRAGKRYVNAIEKYFKDKKISFV